MADRLDEIRARLKSKSYCRCQAARDVEWLVRDLDLAHGMLRRVGEKLNLSRLNDARDNDCDGRSDG